MAKFQRPPNILHDLLHETIVQAAKLNPDYPYMFTLDSDNPVSEIKVITYKRFVSDAARLAKTLQRSIPKRTPGTTEQNIGFFSMGEYSYAVHIVACQFNNWSVSLRLRT